jgi:hypothetical protein
MRHEYEIAHPVAHPEAMDPTVVGDRNQPNHVQMEGYYDRCRSKAGLEQPSVCQDVEGTIGRALERMEDG